MDTNEQLEKQGPDTPDAQNVEELSKFMHNFLTQIQDKFQTASDQILGKIDSMTQRIDELEKNITELSKQADHQLPSDSSN